MRRPALLSRLPAPFVTTSLLLLFAMAVAFWGQGVRGSPSSVAQLARTHARLSDGDCEFTADVQLASRWSGFSFSMHEGDVRSALIALLRSKSRYMVSTAPARESLRVQMLAAVNGVIGSGRATDLHLTDFQLM